MKEIEFLSDYTDFIKRSPVGNIFQTQEYFNILKAIGWNPFALAVVDGDHCRGVLIGYSPIGIPVISRVIRNIFVYLGPVVQNEDTESLKLLLGNLVRKAKQMNAIRIFLRTPFPFPQQYRIFTEQDFVKHDVGGEYSVLIDLTKELDVLWSQVKKTFRKRIRQARKKGVYLKKIETLEELFAFYQIYLNTSKRRQFFPYPFTFFEALWSQLQPKELGQFLLAIYNGKIIAGMINLAFNGKVMTFISGSLPKYWNLNPNHMLQWYSIEQSKEGLHAHTFDIFHVTATKPKLSNDIDYYTFKTSFGGQLVKESSFYFRTISHFRHNLYRIMTEFSSDLFQPFARRRHSTTALLEVN